MTPYTYEAVDKAEAAREHRSARFELARLVSGAGALASRIRDLADLVESAVPADLVAAADGLREIAPEVQRAGLDLNYQIAVCREGGGLSTQGDCL